MRRTATSTTILFLALRLTAPAAPAPLVLNDGEMAGISGLRNYWDTPVVVAEDGATRMAEHGRHGSGPVADWSTDAPGAPVFDAVHRSLLVRFPGAAEAVATTLKQGGRIEKAELRFEFVDVEFFPMDYRLPAGMSFLGDLWVRKPPRWHAVAWPLRQAWRADPKTGPTFNASVNGRRYWTRFGARDESEDRFPRQFGPTEVSHQATHTAMDITAVFMDTAFGQSLGERLRNVSDRGFVIRKWETYDALYNHGGYEYGGGPGHRGIRIKAPTLVVSFADGTTELGDLPPAVDVAGLPAAGAPTAVMPSEATIQAAIAEHGAHQPDGMPDWQWQRIHQLLGLSPSETGFPETTEDYAARIDQFNTMPYRTFTGHHTTLTTHDCLLYGQTWPAPVRDHMKRYWDAWLLPGRPYTELQHNQWGIWTKEENSYHNRTGDWRGNHSFYRESYTRFMSTMNFNHNAIMAALLGGSFTDNAEAMDDGRFGLETILLRLWGWYDGTTQESIDHYYLGLTLYGQKAFADLGPTPLDRMMGRSIVLKTMDELAGCYHPALKRFIATSGRTGVAELLAVNEGPNHIMHTVSRKGALHDLDNPNRLGMLAVGHDCPPNLVGRQALIGPWMPLWMGHIVDDKPFPFELTSSYKVWGSHRTFPMWKRSYLSRYYGLATLDVLGGNETVPIMAQWRRVPGDTADIQEIGTLLMRFGINQTEFYDSLYHGSKQSNANGSIGTQGGFTAAVQHHNKAILLTSPYEDLSVHGRVQPAAIHSFQSSIALANYQANPTWRLFIDGVQADLGALPIRAKMTSRITIHDGVTYLGLIPIPATDFGRSEEILITDGGEPVALQGGGKAAPTLVVNSYHYYNQATPFDLAQADTSRLARAVSGFVLELGDVTQYPSFEAFQAHVAATELRIEWQNADDRLQIDYTSGDDAFDVAFRPQFEGARWGKTVSTDHCFPNRRVNGRWPYLPSGMDRDSTLGQQGTAGRLEKNGAVLTYQPGCMGYLLTEPVSGNYLFANPLPDPQFLAMDMPGGVRIKADGRLGMCHVLACPSENRLDIRYAPKPEQTGPGMADALLVFGLADGPAVTLNGKAVTGITKVIADTLPAWRVPLSDAAARLSGPALTRKYERAALEQLAAFSSVTGVRADMKYLPGQEHYILTEPRVGAYSFWRQWPGLSPIEITVPGATGGGQAAGVRVATDGSLALQRLVVSPSERHILVDYAPYLQVDKDNHPVPNRAKALLVFGMDAAPRVVLHGKTYEGTPNTVHIGDETAYLVPLFDDPPGSLKAGATERYEKAMQSLGSSR